MHETEQLETHNLNETERLETHSLNEAGQLETHRLNFHAQAGEGSESTGERDSGTSDAIHVCMEGGAQRGKDQDVEEDGCRMSWETECVRFYCWKLAASHLIHLLRPMLEIIL